MRLVRPATAGSRLPGAREAAIRAFRAAALAAVAALAAAAPAEEPPAEMNALRNEMDLLWLDASADHATVRDERFEDGLGAFASHLRIAVRTYARNVPKIDDESRNAAAHAIAEAALRSFAADGGGPPPLRPKTLEFLLHRALPAEIATFGADHENAWFATFLFGEARSLLAGDRFEDAWDTVFRDAPAVVAWRRAHAPEGSQPEGPRPATDEGDGAADLLAAALVEVDAARAWVGPWTGWNTDVRDKDNRRQKRPARTVWIERHEVTCAAWKEFLASVESGQRADLLPTGWTLDESGGPRVPEGRERHPVTGVTWAMAARYAESRGMRLPTEDEWDRAAGGGEKEGRTFPWGASAEGRKWARLGVAPEGTSAVDAFPDDATPDGIAGLAGNVAEWTATYADRRDVPKSGPAADEQVVVRGGSFRAREVECASTYRRLLEAGRRAEHVGFRCVMDDAEYRRRTRSGAAGR